MFAAVSAFPLCHGAQKEMKPSVTSPIVETSEKADAAEQKVNDAVMNYRLTRKSALGMFFVALGSVFGRWGRSESVMCSLMSAVVSALGKKYKIPAPTITFVRSLFNLAINLVCCAIVRVNPIGPVKEHRKYAWIILRGLFGGIQITCYFFAFTKVLPVSARDV